MKLSHENFEEFDSDLKELYTILFNGVMINPQPLGYLCEQTKFSESTETVESYSEFNREFELIQVSSSSFVMYTSNETEKP